MKTARLFILLALVSLLFVNAGPALAQNQLKGVTTVLGDPRPAEPTTYTFTFSAGTSATILAFQFNFCVESSGGCTKPSGFTAVNSTYVPASTTGIGTSANWAMSADDAYFTRISYATGHGLTLNDPVTIRMGTITNQNIDSCDSETSSDTCYVQIETCASVDCSGTNIDEGIGTFTVVSAVTVTARVDPTFIFRLAGTGANTAHNGITSSVATSVTGIPFGNMAAETPKYAAHQLNVTTNTMSGYTVKMRALVPGQTQGVMEGVYTANNIDPFVAPWGTPTSWTQPSGSAANVNTGWLGANTTDTDVAGWSSGTNLFGEVVTTDRIVMQKNTSDNGVDAVYVTYALEANVFQPADTYTGTLVFTATPTY